MVAKRPTATEVTKALAEAPTDGPEPALADAADLNIYQRIAAISKEAGALAPESKGGVPFAFRGVDGTVAHVTPFLHKYGVFITPSSINHIVTEREVADKQGNPTGRVVKTSQVETTFDVYGPDGYGFSIQTAGLADDFADRSAAQAQSVAYRIALLQLFHLPTHDKEPEERGEEVQRGLAEANAGGGETKSRGQIATDKARSATGPAGKSLTQLQNEAKALGRKLDKTPKELNALGEQFDPGNEDWFTSAATMQKIVDHLTAEAADK